ncbi:MAG: DUF2065 domain-containing protein [Acidiferrobacterales bacterium]|nr:DUF2065 domain-containing protein [Acidiferrobacterales bacterium]
MNWNDLLAAFALYLVFEGIIPFVNPSAFRQFVLQMTGLPDAALRRFGLASMALGLGLLYLVRS